MNYGRLLGMIAASNIVPVRGPVYSDRLKEFFDDLSIDSEARWVHIGATNERDMYGQLKPGAAVPYGDNGLALTIGNSTAQEMLGLVPGRYLTDEGLRNRRDFIDAYNNVYEGHVPTQDELVQEVLKLPSDHPLRALLW